MHPTLLLRYDSTCYIGFNGAVSSLLFAIETQMTIGAWGSKGTERKRQQQGENNEAAEREQ
jgi:hypothetical protein